MSTIQTQSVISILFKYSLFFFGILTILTGFHSCSRPYQDPRVSLVPDFIQLQKEIPLKGGKELVIYSWGPQQSGLLLFLESNPVAQSLSVKFKKLAGPTQRIWAGDLDEDGSLELYLLSRLKERDYANLTCEEEEQNGWRLIDFPQMGPPDDENAYTGYRGFDDIEIQENKIIRRFPVYKPQDNDSLPSQGWRELTYTYENKKFILRNLKIGK